MGQTEGFLSSPTTPPENQTNDIVLPLYSILYFAFLNFIFPAPDQPIDHLLQLHPEGGAPGQEDHPAGLLLLLHPRQDDAGEGHSSRRLFNSFINIFHITQRT